MKRSAFLSAFVLLLGALLISALPGCRIVGQNSDGESATSGNQTITGKITADAASLNVVRSRVNGDIRPDVSGVPGADVWLEEYPTIRGTTDANGVYVLANVPPGQYRVVARLKKGDGTELKTRSDAVGGEGTSNLDLTIVQAENRVAGVLRGADGNFLPVGTVLTLWGESFVVGENGYFESPPLPSGIASAEIVIPTTGNSQGMRLLAPFLAPFVNGNRPIIIEMTLPGTGDGAINHPPSALAFPRRADSLISNRVSSGERVTFTGVGNDIDTGDNDALTYAWTKTDGEIISGQTDKEMVWNAPTLGGIATITLKVTDRNGAIGTVNVVMVVQGPTSYVLTLQTEHGTITKNPNQNSFSANAQVTLTATPDTGYLFTGWAGALTGTTNPSVLTMNGNKTVTATFALKQYALTISTANGTIANNPVPTQNPNLYNHGTVVTLTATPNSGYVFKNWLGDVSETANPLTLPAMTANQNITANFVQPVIPSLWFTHGSISLTDPLIPEWDATANAIASPGYLFTGWSGGTVTGNTNPQTFTVGNTATLNAHFASRITAGTASSRGIKSDGSIISWGIDWYNNPRPAATDYVAVAGNRFLSGGNENHYLTLHRDGTITQVDNSGWAMFGTAPAGTGHVTISAGYAFSAAVKSDGSIALWGHPSYVPAAPSPNSGFVAVEASNNNQAVGLKQDGTLVGIGVHAAAPPAPPAGTRFVQVTTCGSKRFVGLLNTGKLVAWDTTVIPPNIRAVALYDIVSEVKLDSNQDYVAIAGSPGYGGCLVGLRKGGSIVVWSYAGSALLTGVPAGTDFVAIAAGNEHALAMKADGTVVGWGTTNFGATDATKDERLQKNLNTPKTMSVRGKFGFQFAGDSTERLYSTITGEAEGTGTDSDTTSGWSITSSLALQGDETFRWQITYSSGARSGNILTFGGKPSADGLLSGTWSDNVGGGTRSGTWTTSWGHAMEN